MWITAHSLCYWQFYLYFWLFFAIVDDRASIFLTDYKQNVELYNLLEDAQ